MRVSELFGIEGKVAIVTGGSRGIGYMIAEGLLSNGVKTYITSRKADELNAAQAELSKVGECIAIPADLSTDEGLAGFVAAYTERERELHILCNNAGAAWGAPLGSFPSSGFDKVLGINVKAPFMLTQALLPQLKAAATEEDPARVIMIGSIDGMVVPIGDNFSYSGSKAAIHMLARHLAHNVVGDNITVNTVAPGPFRSKMMGYLLDDPDSRERIARRVPRKRIGTPADVAGAVIYLSSRAGAWLTGVLIPVDGGLSTHG
ncbi:MAG: SDR family oxidoreductase [Acidimicrobiales bacterium]|nr:SDR family oxidoreductase [Acidimicrobiales bacterium]